MKSTTFLLFTCTFTSLLRYVTALPYTMVKKPFIIPVSASWSRWPPKSDQLLLVTHPVPPKIFVEIHRQFLSRVSQHTIHAERELFYQFRLSNAGTVSKLMHISSIFDILVGYLTSFFSSPTRRNKIPTRTPSAGALNTRRVGKVGKYCHFSRKWYEIGLFTNDYWWLITTEH